MTHSRDAVPLKMSDLDDALVRAAGDDEGQDPYYRLGSRDTVPLNETDLDDALVRAAGDDKRQDPRYNPPD